MNNSLTLNPDRLFPIDHTCRTIAQQLYKSIENLPIISPHGHTDPKWFADNVNFKDPHSLFMVPDHYLLRMLYSQGISLARLGISAQKGEVVATPREAWRVFAKHYFLFVGTPTALWLNHIFYDLFEFKQGLNEATADDYFDIISARLKQDNFKARALFDRFNIEFLSTTEAPENTLIHHQKISKSDWSGNVVTSYRPDSVIDPEHHNFKSALKTFGELTGENIDTWEGYLAAHRSRRAYFMSMGATSTDHGHPTANTANLSTAACITLYNKIVTDCYSSEDAELFRAQMLTEMAKMSIDDGLVMQIHPGSYRNHNPWLFNNYGSDKGADIPKKVEYTKALKPLLDYVGNNANLTIILFTLDESNYTRELAPLVGHYPCLRLGPAWWFHDTPEGIMRYRKQTSETAGFYNTVGFNDDTRAFLSIPARHDMARRVDCAYLSKLVADHRLSEEDAHTVIADLTYYLPKKSYKINVS